jgi:hypothetical protein
VVTATTCHLTAIGRDNIDNLARYATTIEVSPNKLVRGRLNRLGLTLVGDISWPEHVSIFTTPFRVACDTGIPLILYGENPQEAYGGPKGSEQAKEMTRRWVSEFGGFLGLRPGDMIGQEGITELDMLDYMPPLPKELDKVGVQAYFLGQFYFWDSHENARVAKEHGCKWWDGPPCLGSSWPFENLDNYQTPLHDHMMYRKYGYGRLAAQVSVDVRAGLMSRSHALDMVRMWDGAFPTHSLDLPIHRVLGNIGMTLDDLKPLLERFTDRSLFTEHERDLWPRLLEFV